MNAGKIWNSWSEEVREHFLTKVMPRSRYIQYLKLYSDKGVKTAEELKSIGAWYREGKNVVQEEELESLEINMLHSKAYWYDENRDVYIVHMVTKNKPMIVKGDMWRAIVDSYSNWDGAPLTLNQICRKFSISRKTATQLLKIMGMTHDSAPFTDEVLAKATEEALIEDVIRKKEERVLLKIQQIEWNRVNRDANRYRVYSNFCNSIKHMFSTIKTLEPVKKKRKAYSSGTYSIIVSPTDFHWGKYGAKYTGDEYNREVAKERLFSSTEELFHRIQCRNTGLPSRIIVAIGGDGLHIDNQSKTTTKGTPQDCDGTPSEIASSYVRLCVEYVTYLQSICPVQVFVLQGNHDFYTSTILREAIKAWFRNEKDVEVFDSLSPRQTMLYGNSLITFMHGDEGSVKDYPTIIASENAEEFGKSKWRFIFTGHLHTERELPQWGDTTVYRMPSLAGTDEYHYRKGYKSRKALIGYLIDLEKGVVAQEIVPVMPKD